MAHKTKVNGTNYEISGGKTRVNGTNYGIDKGKTLVGGTAYKIDFIPSLNDCTPAEIKAIAQSGQAPNYWAVGDTVDIMLSGTVGLLTLNDTYCAFIIGFNHNSSIEGNNTIHFQFGKTRDGIDIAFVDSYSGDVGADGSLYMNTTETSSGGWASSYMRNTVCTGFENIMPVAWQNVLTPCTKYSDNTGGTSDTASYVTPTADRIWILAEYEYYGKRFQANSAEQNYQKQYAYYAAGNGKSKYCYNNLSSGSTWWVRSSSKKADGAFVMPLVGGSLFAGAPANWSLGFTPCFMVG